MLRSVPRSIRAALEILASQGFDAYLVGGCVRDWLMGNEPHDFDITTSATPDEMKRVFADHRVIETGIKHGTLTVIIEGEPIEITTYRVDGRYVDNRRPESVSFTPDLHEDLKRRDFTMNAIAYGLDGICDLFDGRRHIEERRIVCVGEADMRFNEDALRIMRAMRFSATLGFEIAPATKRSIHKNAALLENISAERKLAELTKLICGKNAGAVLSEFSDVLRVILPILDRLENLDAFCSQAPNRELRFAALLEPLGAQTAVQALTALRADNRLIHTVSRLISNAHTKVTAYPDALRLIHALGWETAELLADYQHDRRFAEFINRAKAEHACVSEKDLAINGNDLIDLGIPTGAQLGDTLSALLNLVIDGEVANERTTLLSAAEEINKKR